MRVKLQLVICHDDGQEETVTDVIALNKNNQRIEHLGLSLAESQQLLGTLQRHLLQQQVNTFLNTHATCPDCGTPLKLKAHGSHSFRTLFGTFQFYSPRREHCDCTRHNTASFRPLSALLTEPVAPALLYMEAKWSSLVSYGLSLDALKDFLPIALSLDVKTVRYDTLKVAKRLEAELGEDQASFIEGEPSDGDLLPPPEGSFKVGIDGGYVRHWFDKKHNFEVIVGKSILSFAEDEEGKTPSLKRFGFVQTLDTKSKRRLYEVLQSQDFQMNQEITFLAEGDDHAAATPVGHEPKSHPYLGLVSPHDEAHGVRPIRQSLVQCEAVLGEAIRDKIERLQWSLWHGQVDKALGKIDDLERAIEPCSATSARFLPLVKAWSELRTSIVHNRHVIPHDGERYHHGEAIATGCVESTGNEVVSRRFCKQQQMQWSKKGAHVLLQTRVRTLNGELGTICKRWYPDMDLEVEAISVAA